MRQHCALLIATALLAIPGIAAGQNGSESTPPSPDIVPRIAPRIANGVPTGQWPSVGHLSVEGSSCTATFIGCLTAITAAHCVCAVGGTGDACPDGEAVVDPVGLSIFSQHAGFFFVREIRVPPNYEFGVESDVAVLELLSPVRSIRPAPINRLASPEFNSAGTLVGFGRTSDVAPDFGIKREGDVRTTSCALANVPNTSHTCWNFNPPVGPPGTESTTCAGDSGGPLFIDVGAGTSLAGIHSGGPAECTSSGVSFDTDVYDNRDWLDLEAGADLGNTACGDGLQVGDVGLTSVTLTDSVSDQDLHSMVVPDDTKELTVTLNAELGSEFNDFDLYLRRGQAPTLEDFDCISNFPGSFEECYVGDPASGSWYALVDVFDGGPGEYQITWTLIPANPPPPPLAAGDLVLSDFYAWELMRVDPNTGDRSIISSPLRGSGAALMAPEGVALDPDGTILVANLAAGSIIRVDPKTGDRTVVSGCPDFACALSVGAGPPFLGPRFIVRESASHLLLTDREIPGLVAVVRVESQSGDRTVLSGCADLECTTQIGDGPQMDMLFGIALGPQGQIIVADSFALLGIDPQSGDRTVLSGLLELDGDIVLAAGPSFGQLRDFVVLGDDIYVAASHQDSSASAIFHVDLATGIRTVVSGCADPICNAQVGSGPELDDQLTGITLDSDDGLLVTELDPGKLFRVALPSGDRTILSGCSDAQCAEMVAAGTHFTGPLGVVVIPEAEGALCSVAVFVALAAIARRRRIRALG